MTRDAIVEKLRAALAGAPIDLAILFGSFATGRAHRESDVDVGILPSSAAMTLGEELALARRLEEAVGREVDVVRLDEADPLVLREVAEHGAQLAGDARTYARFRAEAMLTWIDFEPTYRAAAERFRARLAAR